jgi:hypothetical protein
VDIQALSLSASGNGHSLIKSAGPEVRPERLRAVKLSATADCLGVSNGKTSKIT